MSSLAEVRLWGRRVGAVLLPDEARVSLFQYDPDFLTSGIQLAPLHMPLGPAPYTFPALADETFRGLAGMLADSLPDRFGNALIDAWLAGQGRTPDSFNAIERLCYIGSRGMGALEFQPTLGPASTHSEEVHLDELVELASDALARRKELAASLAHGERTRAMREILSVGTSAGGARAKAVIAWNPSTHEIRSGQVAAPEGFQYWLLKLDGVENNKDKDRLADPQGYGAIEFAYSLMAKAAGVQMTDCRLLEEGGRRHFITQRFDRSGDGAKLHMQSLGALAHLDFNQPRANSYEQAFLTIHQLAQNGLLTDGAEAIEQMFRRMAFNIVARNQDDHVKNIAFLMGRDGLWTLAPAFDVTYAYRPDSRWTGRHQMSMNGKREDFTLADFRDAGRRAGLKRGRPERIVRELQATVGRWPSYAEEADIDAARAERIRKTLRLTLPAS